LFSGFRDFPAGARATPNPALCGAGLPFLRTSHSGTGDSNVGSFSSTEGHCINVATGAITNGQFTFDFGNGNTFFGTYVGNVQLPLPALAGDTRGVTLTYTITGGTGTFSGASGILLGAGELTFITTAGGVAPMGHIEINTVPEPATFLLLATGLACAGGIARKWRLGRN